MPRWPKRKARPGVDEYGRTQLWYRALQGDLPGVRDEISRGADPSAGDDVDYSPLHAAVQEGHLPVVKFLLESGADANKVDKHGNGPLWTAVLSARGEQQIEIITTLLSAGAEPHRKNRYGHSPFEVSIKMGKEIGKAFGNADPDTKS